MSSTVSDFVSIEPESEVSFQRPFNSVVKQTLTLTNTLSDSAITFKVKTTAPKLYCVRPNAGRIPPGGSAEVTILLQAMKEDPPADFKCKDKFLIQSIKISPQLMDAESEAASQRLGDLWAHAEQLKKDLAGGAGDILSEKKIKVSYLPAGAFSGNHRSGSVSNGSNNNSQELKELKDKVKALQTSVETYKTEAERLKRETKTANDKAAAASKRSEVEGPKILVPSLAGLDSVLPLDIVALIVSFLMALLAYSFASKK
jgi:hypothetical protein